MSAGATIGHVDEAQNEGELDAGLPVPRGTRKAWVLRVLAVLALPLCLVGALAALAWWLDGDKKLTLDYVRALAWPLVAASLIWWLRDPLRRKLESLLQLDVAGTSMRFRDATDELEDDVQSAVRVLVHTSADGAEQPETAADGGTGAAAPNEAPTPAPVRSADEEQSAPGRDGAPEQRDPGPAPERVFEDGPTSAAQEAAADLAPLRRAAVEQLIRDSAAWGFDMAALGFESHPVPVIEWTDDGTPRIRRAIGQRKKGPARVSRAQIARSDEPSDGIRRMEHEVQRLEREAITASMGGNFQQRYAVEQQLERMRRNLRNVDPMSPWAF